MGKFFRQLLYGLRFRLLVLVILACAPLVGLTLHTAWDDRRRQVADWQQRSKEMVQLAGREEEKVIGQTRQLLFAVAESSQVRSGNHKECKKYLDQLFESYPRYANLGVIKTNGDFLASALPAAEPVQPADLQFFRRVLKTRAFAIGDFPVGHTNSKATVNFGCPLFDQSGQIQAVVFAALDLAWFNRYESELQAQLPKDATWTQIDQRGTILVRNPAPEKWIGQPLPQKGLMQTVSSETNGVVEALDLDGVPSFYGFTSMHSQLFPGDVVTLLGIPKQVLFAGVERMLARNLAGVALVGALALVLGWAASNLLVLRQVRALVNSSARLASGDLSARTGLPQRGDELGRLTGAFDQMAQSLEQRDLKHQQAEKALMASEMRYHRLFDTAQDGILILDAATGRIDDVNSSVTEMLGYARDTLIGNKLWEISPFKEIEAFKSAFAELERQDCVRLDDLSLMTIDGGSIHVEFVSNVYQINGGRVVQCNIRNISKRRRAEGRLQEYSRKLQVLSRRLVEVQETERRHIALELHDEIGQALTVAELNLQAMLESPGTEALLPRLKESLEVVERVLEQVHDLALNLRPSMLDDLGLEPALLWLTNRQAELTGLQAEFEADALEQRLDPVIETECFRVAQEALTNVVRHAQARTVNVDLRTANGHLHLRVRDDGRGFDVTTVLDRAVRGVSLGLLSMEERAARAGGGLEYNSDPGQGTEVHAWFPLRWQTPPS
ncbi:MAG: PAS domain S-box protein [Verrucomicrobia bacterium]|nr:PAS domain S-box protein [Verrucomicrobiota bacterium]